MSADRDALITEMQPLIPQAHAVFLPSRRDKRRSPVGKGIPIRNDGNVITTNDATSFATEGHPLIDCRKGDKKRANNNRRLIISSSILLNTDHVN